MPADLTTVPDHPARLMRALADQATTSSEPIDSIGFHVAAASLDRYEREHGVTFAALPNTALAILRATYRSTDPDAVPSTALALQDLRDAVRRLLNLDD